MKLPLIIFIIIPGFFFFLLSSIFCIFPSTRKIGFVGLGLCASVVLVFMTLFGVHTSRSSSAVRLSPQPEFSEEMEVLHRDRHAISDDAIAEENITVPSIDPTANAVASTSSMVEEIVKLQESIDPEMAKQTIAMHPPRIQMTPPPESPQEKPVANPLATPEATATDPSKAKSTTATAEIISKTKGKPEEMNITEADRDNRSSGAKIGKIITQEALKKIEDQLEQANYALQVLKKAIPEVGKIAGSNLDASNTTKSSPAGETAASPTPVEFSTPEKSDATLPDWVEKGDDLSKDGNTYYKVVKIGPWNTLLDCESKVNGEVTLAAREFAEKMLGTVPDVNRIRLSDQEIRTLIHARATEVRNFSYGPMTTLHLQLQFDAKAKGLLKMRYREAIGESRVQVAAYGLGSVLFVLAAAWVRLRIPSRKNTPPENAVVS